MKQIFLLALLSLTLLSCEKEVPKYPDHPITYEVHGDSVTVYRHFKSDSRTNDERFVKNIIPEITISISDSVQLKEIAEETDSLNRLMVMKGYWVGLMKEQFIVPDTIQFEYFYTQILKNFYRDLKSQVIINGTTLPSIEEIRYQYDKPYIYFKEDKPYIHLIENTSDSSSLERNDQMCNDQLHANVTTRIIDTLFNLDFPYASLIDPKEFSVQNCCIKSSPTNELQVIIDNEQHITIEDITNLTSIMDSIGNDNWEFSFKVYTLDEIDSITISKKNVDTVLRGLFGGKPIIYLYPEVTTDISVQIDSSVDFTFTYPHYPDSGWNVSAEPSGDLTDTVTGKQYYSLFWEGYINYITDFSEGFVVPSTEIVPFLEEKLEILGLNFREAQEFILYWAPFLEQNEFSLIHFATDEYAEAVTLTITPEPDTEIRIMMSFKSIGLGYDVIGQELTRVKRSGFTVVEWGGSNYDRDHLVQ